MISAAPVEQSEATTFAVQVCYRFPLTLGRSDLSAALEVRLRLERQAGQLTQGKVIRSVTLPPGGAIQLVSTDAARFILDEDGLSVFRCEGLPAEEAYMQSMCRGLGMMGMVTPDRAVGDRRDAAIVLDADPISIPFLPVMLQNIVDHTEAHSRWSEAIARRARAAVARGPAARRLDGSRSYTRNFANPSSQRALTLSFYHADKHQLVRCGLSRIERVVKAADGTCAAGDSRANLARAEQARADIDQQLIAEGLLDTQGQLPLAAQQRYRWQRSFRLPAPHTLVRTCPLDTITDPAVLDTVKVELLPRAA